MNYLHAAAAGAGLLAGWALLENTAMLRVRRYSVRLPAFPRTAVIADLHKREFGKGNCRLAERVASLHPALILIAGDLISRTVRDFSGTESLVRRLTDIAPVLAIPGNHEADLPAQQYAEFRSCLERAGVTLLENSRVTVNGLAFAGLYLPREYYRGGGRFGYVGKQTCTADTLRELLGDCGENTVLLAHNPLFFPAYAQWGAALTVAGHIHGGAVRLPAVGGLLSPERRFFPKYDRGSFTDGTHRMIVSGGLGKLRLFNPPEILLLTPEDGATA